MITKQDENMVNRLRDHGYKCDISFEGGIVKYQSADLGTAIGHSVQGRELTRSLKIMLQGISKANLKQINAAIRNALIRVEDFVKYNTEHQENEDLMSALNHIASALSKTESNIRNNEAMKWVDEEEEKND